MSREVLVWNKYTWPLWNEGLELALRYRPLLKSSNSSPAPVGLYIKQRLREAFS